MQYCQGISIWHHAAFARFIVSSEGQLVHSLPLSVQQPVYSLHGVLGQLQSPSRPIYCQGITIWRLSRDAFDHAAFAGSEIL